MKRLILILLTTVAFLSSCHDSRVQNMEKRENELNLREQELLRKEKALELREADLVKREQKTDSLMSDSTAVPPVVAGTWTTKMTCTETTCTGSAVGDIKTEQWNVILEGNSIIARAIAGEQLVRVYTGSYTGNTIELVEDRESTSTQPATKMIVRLRLTNGTTMEGQREIVRENDCKIIYAVQMNKQ